MSEEVLHQNQTITYCPLSHFALLFGNQPRRLSSPRLIYLLIFIKAGNGRCFIDDNCISLKPGTLLVVNPYSFLELENVQYLRGEVIAFTEAFFCKSTFNDILLYKTVYQPKRDLVFHLEGNPRLTDHIVSSIDILKRQLSLERESPLGAELVLSLLSGFVLLFHQLQLQSENAPYDIEESFAKKRIVEFIRLLNAHFLMEDNLGFYADQMGLSIPGLSRLCLKGIGWNAKAMMQSKVIIEAKRLVLFDKRPLQEIGFDLGFQEHSAFVNFFRQFMQVSPKEYKANFLAKKQKTEGKNKSSITNERILD